MYFCQMVVCKKEKKINEDPNFWSNIRAQKKNN